MKKSLNTTFILTGICLLLLAWYLGYEKKWRPQNKDKEEKAKQLITVDKDAVQEVELERMTNGPAEGTTPPADFKPQYEVVKLKKTGSDWHVISPIQDSADSGLVHSMLSTLATTKHDRVVEEKPTDLAPFGLKDPFIKIKVRKDTNSAAEEVWIGANTPVSYNCYAKTSSSEKVYRVPRALKTAVDKPLKELRNRAIMLLSRAEIKEVEIQTGKESFIVKKEDNKDEWWLARENMPVDLGEWNKTLNSFLDTRAGDFPSMEGKSLASFGLAPAAVKATFIKQDKTKVTVLLGRQKTKDKEKAYAKREDKEVIYEVDKTIVEAASRPSTTYRSKQLAKFSRYDVVRIKLERANEPVELYKDSAKWTLVADPKANVDGAKIDSLLTKLQDIKIEKYLGEKAPKPQVANAALVIRLYEKKEGATPPPAADKNQTPAAAAEEEKVLLVFSKPKGKEVTASRTDLPLAFTIKEEDYKSLDLTKKEFIAPEVKSGDSKTDDKKSSEQQANAKPEEKKS